MKTITIKKLGILSVAKVSAALYAVLGLAVGLFASIFAFGMSGGGGLGASLGVFSIVVFPLGYGIMGFIGGLIMGFVFNLVAPRVGGLELKVEEDMPIAQ